MRRRDFAGWPAIRCRTCFLISFPSACGEPSACARGSPSPIAVLLSTQLWLDLTTTHLDVEMVRRLLSSDRRVESDCWSIDQVSLHKDDVDVALRSNVAKFVYEPSGNALAPVAFCNRQVIDVNLAPILLELVQHVR